MMDARTRARREEGGPQLSLCVYCAHLIPGVAATCRAFPDGIPQPFNAGVAVHTAPYPGDNGLRFERAEWARHVPEATIEALTGPRGGRR